MIPIALLLNSNFKMPVSATIDNDNGLSTSHLMQDEDYNSDSDSTVSSIIGSDQNLSDGSYCKSEWDEDDPLSGTVNIQIVNNEIIH